MLDSHGLFTWADDAKTCYELTLSVIQKATDWFAEKTKHVPLSAGRCTKASMPMRVAPSRPG